MSLFEQHQPASQIELRPQRIDPPLVDWVLLASYSLGTSKIELHGCEMFGVKCYRHVCSDRVLFSTDADRKLRTSDFGEIATVCWWRNQQVK